MRKRFPDVRGHGIKQLVKVNQLLLWRIWIVMENGRTGKGRKGKEREFLSDEG